LSFYNLEIGLNTILINKLEDLFKKKKRIFDLFYKKKSKRRLWKTKRVELQPYSPENNSV
jgi:hypothetical protein